MPQPLGSLSLAGTVMPHTAQVGQLGPAERAVRGYGDRLTAWRGDVVPSNLMVTVQ